MSGFCSRYKKEAKVRIRSNLLLKQNNCCAICGDIFDLSINDGNDPLYATVDHIVPLSLGGAHAVANLQLTHGKCNAEKGNKLPGTKGSPEPHKPGALRPRAEAALRKRAKKELNKVQGQLSAFI